MSSLQSQSRDDLISGAVSALKAVQGVAEETKSPRSALPSHDQKVRVRFLGQRDTILSRLIVYRACAYRPSNA